jgi:RNA polymerase sigma-70 factor (ECF subfamily)
MDPTTRQAARYWTLAQPAVSAFVAAVVHDFRDRDDVLQDIAVAVLESFPAYDPARPFNAWAIGVARNQVRLYLRRRRRDRLVFDEATIACLADAFGEIDSEQVRRLDVLRECLAMLANRARGLCQLRYEQDLKPAAIADRVGMTPNSVAKALQRIRDQLRECLDRRAPASQP